MAYQLTDDGKIKDTKTGFVLPDNYWIMDLLNLKQKRIDELEKYIVENDLTMI